VDQMGANSIREDIRREGGLRAVQKPREREAYKRGILGGGWSHILA
jgi:hypothetical protein